MAQILNLSTRYADKVFRAKPATFPKGSPEWNWFSDFYQMARSFWNVEADNESYWYDLTMATSGFYSKYKQDPKLEDLTKRIVVAFMSFLEDQARDPERFEVNTGGTT